MQLVTEEELWQLLQKDYVILEHSRQIFTFNLFSIRNCVTPLIWKVPALPWLPQDGRRPLCNGKLFGKERLHSRPLAAGRGAWEGCRRGGAGPGMWGGCMKGCLGEKFNMFGSWLFWPGPLTMRGHSTHVSANYAVNIQ